MYNNSLEKRPQLRPHIKQPTGSGELANATSGAQIIAKPTTVEGPYQQQSMVHSWSIHLLCQDDQDDQ